MNVNIMNMKTRLIAVVSAVAVSCLAFILSNTAVAQMRKVRVISSKTRRHLTRAKFLKQGAGGAAVATQITPQDAAKKYPAPKGKYPMGERDPHNADGVVNSPYPPRTAFDCSNIPHGGLVLRHARQQGLCQALALSSFELAGQPGGVFEYHRRKLSVASVVQLVNEHHL